jgi:hypothetical protein
VPNHCVSCSWEFALRPGGSVGAWPLGSHPYWHAAFVSLSRVYLFMLGTCSPS